MENFTNLHLVIISEQIGKLNTFQQISTILCVTHYAVHSFKSCWLIFCILNSKAINFRLYTCNYKYYTLSLLAAYLWVSTRLMGGLGRSICVHAQVDFFFGAV